MTALVTLYRYQKAWIADEARFKIYIKARQIGITFATTLRHVRRRLAKRGTTIWVSASERQSKEAIEYVKVHCQALGEAFDYEEIEFPGIDAKALQVTFKHNGARFIAMPANPDTLRGYSGDVVLDEFGFHRDAMKIWRAVMAIVSRGFSLEVISTPNGQQGKFFDISKLVECPMQGESTRTHWVVGIWSVHWCDIHEAVRQGCDIKIDEMREAAGDEDTWLQEYCCVFLADAENFIPMELILACESELASIDMPKEFQPAGDLFLGIDIGRRKDRTVLWIFELVGDVKITRMVQTLERQKFAAQEAAVDLIMPMVRRSCVDSTGLGMQMAENLQAKWGEGKVEAVEFNIANKEVMATKMKAEMEERRCRIPYHPNVRRAINAVKRYNSPTGHFRFDAERTELGHADEWWAMCLANLASTGAMPAVAAVEESEGVVRAERRGMMSELARINSATQETLIEQGVVAERRSVWR